MIYHKESKQVKFSDRPVTAYQGWFYINGSATS